jgi:hypothetical protein
VQDDLEIIYDFQHARLASGLPGGAAVACVACPTLYAYLRKSSPDVPARLLEYDERFGQYGDDFAFYDYNQPEALPPAMKHCFQIVVADPPYLVWSPSSFVLLSSGVQKSRFD